MQVKSSVLWGLCLGLASSLGTQILTWMGLGLTNWFVILTFIFVILFVALALQKIKRQNEGKLKFLEAAGNVLIMILIARLIFQFYMFLYITYVDPEWVDRVATDWQATLLDSGANTDQVNQTIDGFRKAWKPSAIFTIELVKYGVPQFIIGMIVSLFFVFRK